MPAISLVICRRQYCIGIHSSGSEGQSRGVSTLRSEYKSSPIFAVFVVNKVALGKAILRKLWLHPLSYLSWISRYKFTSNSGFYWNGISRHADSLCSMNKPVRKCPQDVIIRSGFPLLLSLLPNLVPISRKLPSILTRNISPFRNVATDTQSTVLDIFESMKFTFVISQISIFDVEKRAGLMFDTQLFLRPQSSLHKE